MMLSIRSFAIHFQLSQTGESLAISDTANSTFTKMLRNEIHELLEKPSGISMTLGTIKAMAAQRGLDFFEILGWDPHGRAAGGNWDPQATYNLSRAQAMLLGL